MLVGTAAVPPAAADGMPAAKFNKKEHQVLIKQASITSCELLKRTVGLTKTAEGGLLLQIRNAFSSQKLREDAAAMKD